MSLKHSFSTQCWKCKKNRPTSQFSCFIKIKKYIYLFLSGILFWQLLINHHQQMCCIFIKMLILKSLLSLDWSGQYGLPRDFRSGGRKKQWRFQLWMNLMLMRLSLPELFSSKLGCRMWSSLTWITEICVNRARLNI